VVKPFPAAPFNNSSIAIFDNGKIISEPFCGKELREALDGVLKGMWADGSLHTIKRVYLDPLEIEPATSP